MKIVHLFLLICAYAQAMDYVSLPIPDLSQENIKDVHAGLRPYRKECIRIEAQELEDKLIIHNYGYGGGGVSLSWGGTEYGFELLSQRMKQNPVLENQEMPIAILGGGIIGLTQAYQLLLKGYKNVCIYAQTLTPRTTSDVAAGLWGPSTIARGETEEQKEIYKKIEKVSFTAFEKIADDEKPLLPGVRWVDGYRIFEKMTDTMTKPWCIRDFEYTKVKLADGSIVPGAHYKGIIIDMSQYMDALFKKVINDMGAKLEIKKFGSVEEVLALKQNVIFNCTGLGSRELFKDEKLVPVKGHLIAFPQDKKNRIDCRITKDTNISHVTAMIIPWKDIFLVGTITQEDKEDLTVDLAVVTTLIGAVKKALRMD